MQTVHRTTWKGVIGGEQPIENLTVVVTTVRQQGDNTGNKAVDPAVRAEEDGGQHPRSVHGDGDELVLTEKIKNMGDNDPHLLGSFGDTQQWFIGGQDFTGFWETHTNQCSAS